jgi:hypothetical protein
MIPERGSRADDVDAELDPVFVSSLRESKWIVIIWFANFAWVVSFSFWAGYEGDSEQRLVTTLGMPRWVFWGVFFPWIVTAGITCWFALTRMADHPLEDEPPPHHGDESGGAG